MKIILKLTAMLTLVLAICGMSLFENAAPQALAQTDAELLYVLDFRQVPQQYRKNISKAGIGDEGAITVWYGVKWDEYNMIKREELTSRGWTVSSVFKMFDESSSRYFQVVPAYFSVENIYNGIFATQPQTLLGVESDLKLSVQDPNIDYIIIEIDPVSYFESGSTGISYNTPTEPYDKPLQTRTERTLKINGSVVGDEQTGKIKALPAEDGSITIEQATGSSKAIAIYTISVYGEKTASDSGTNWLNDIFDSFGMGGLAMTMQLLILVCIVIVVVKVLKK